MLQQISTGWQRPRSRHAARLRVLVESADPALAASSFARFDEAGLDVTLCAGPAEDAGECPVLRGEPCPLAAGADAILFGLGDGKTDVLRAVWRHHAATPVVVRRRKTPLASDDDLPQGCEVLAEHASVEGQIDALRRAAVAGRRRHQA